MWKIFKGPVSLFKKNQAIAFIIIITICLIAIGHGLRLKSICSEVELKTKRIEIPIEHEQIKSEVIHFTSPKNNLALVGADFLIALGIAGIVTIILMKTIQKAENKKFENFLLEIQRATAEDAIKSIFNNFIEPQFYNAIKRDVINQIITHKDILWDFTIAEEGSDLILTRRLSYKVCNNSDTKYPETITTIQQDSLHATTVDIVTTAYEGDQQKQSKLSDSNHQNNIFKSATLDIVIPPYESVYVSKEFSQLFKNNYVYETQTSLIPMINLDIKVTYPPNYSFELQSGFSSEPKLMVDSNGYKLYKVEGGVLKGQGVEFFCQKKQTNDAPPSNPSEPTPTNV